MEPRFPVGEDTLWFVFHNDQQFGPFVTSELADRMNAGEIAEESFVWAQGFADWVPANEIPGLANYRMDLLSFERVARVEKLNTELSLPKIDFVSAPRSEVEDVIEWADQQAVLNSKNQPQLPAVEEAKSKGPDDHQNSAISFWAAHRYKITISASVLLVAAVSFLSESQNQKTLSQLGLSGPAQIELKNAVSQSLLIHGPKAEIVLASAEDENPKFVIGSNLAEGSILEIRIDGVPGKMLDRVRYAMKTTLRKSGDFQITERLAESDGKSFRAGVYKVSVRDQSKDLLLTSKTLFLGVVPGGDFEASLAAFREKLKEQDKLERIEIKEIFELTSKMLTESTKWFANARSKPDSKKLWNKRRNELEPLESQLTSLVQQWSTEPLASQTVNIEAYKSLSGIIEQIRAGHLAIENFVNVSEPTARVKIQEQVYQAWLRAQSYKETLTRQLSESAPSN